MRPHEVIPAVVIDHYGGFAVDSNIARLIVGVDALSSLGIELDLTDEAEERPVREPQPAVGWIEKEPRIDGVTVFDAVGGGDDGIVMESEHRGLGVERLRPHRVDGAGVPSR